jgi:hypothetical protein
MLRVLECGFNINPLPIAYLEPLLHQGTMRDDVEPPFLEIRDLVLCLANDDLDNRLVEPSGLSL